MKQEDLVSQWSGQCLKYLNSQEKEQHERVSDGRTNSALHSVGRWDGIPGKVGGNKIREIVLKNKFYFSTLFIQYKNFLKLYY